MTFLLTRTLLKRIKGDPLLLVLTLILGPFFVLLYKLIFLQGMTLYEIVVPEPAVGTAPYIETFLDDMEMQTYPGGAPLFKFIKVGSEEEGEAVIQNHDAHCMLQITFEDKKPTAVITGDYSNPYYVICSQLIQNQIKDYLSHSLGYPQRISITEIPMGNSGNKSEFESYVPGLLIFSTLSLLYLFTILLMKECESHVFYRYRMAGVGGMQFLLSYSIPYLLLSVLASGLTMVTAFLLGFHSAVSVLYDIFLSVIVCGLLSMSTTGIAFIVASLASNSMQAFQVATFPFMILVFFSGSVYPFPKIVIAEIAGRRIGLFDILPSTHGVTALNKILTFGQSPADMRYELSAMLLLSIVTYAVGAGLFYRKRLR